MPTVMGIQLPQEAYDYIKIQTDQVFLKTPEDIRRGHVVACTNCGGLGSLVVEVHYPQGKTRAITTIPKANGKGYLTVPVVTKEWPCPICQERTIPIISEMFDDSGLDKEDRKLTIKFLENKEGKEIMLEAGLNILNSIHHPHGLYTFFGGYGTGKTSAMKALVSAAIKAGVKARYRTAEQIIQEMQSVFDPGDDQVQERTKAALIKNYMRYALLCVDEVDRVGLTASGQAFLFELLNRRYESRNSLCTIFSTNKHPDRIGEDFAYLIDRLRDGLRIPVGGPSLRGQ